jgi:hypothetical protein
MKKNATVKKSLLSRLVKTRFFWACLTMCVVIGVLDGICCVIFYQAGRQAYVIGQAHRKAERVLASLDDEYIREEIQWKKMTRPEELNKYLRAYGIPMDFPTAFQIVRMDELGRPLPDQYSLAQLQLSGKYPVAKAKRK